MDVEELPSNIDYIDQGTTEVSLEDILTKDEEIILESKDELQPKPDFESLKREMDVLYGSRALQVHELETSLQMSFDNYCDLCKATPWPIIPFKRN